MAADSLPTSADVERAGAALLALEMERDKLRARRARANTQLKGIGRLTNLLRFSIGARRFCDQTMGRVGALLIVMTCGACAFVVLAHFVGASTFGYLVAAELGLLLTVAVFVPLVLWPNDATCKSWLATWSERLVAATGRVDSLNDQLGDTAMAVVDAETKFFNLKRIVSSHLYFLRTCKWEGMAAGDFERFLTQVFQELGYEIEATGRVGDQGIDLIITRDARRIAVQAKGYPSSTVGNSAIQEAHTGMTFYQCHAAVVVTNSRFTAAARELAQSVGCQLIDGSQILDLIEGRILI